MKRFTDSLARRSQSSVRALTKFGTKGFMSALLAMQISAMPNAFANESTADKIDGAKVDAKKSARAARRDVKKGVRKATGQESTYEDVKDGVKDAGANVKDDAEHLKKKVD